MIKFILSLLVLPVLAFATISAEQEFALNRMNGTAQKYNLGTNLAKTHGLVVGKYSYAIQGGSSAADISLLRDLKDTSSTVVIPSGAIIKQVWFDVLTAPSGGSLAFKAQTTGDLKASLAAGSWTGIVAGIPVGTAATMIKMTADRTVKMTVGSGTLTQGKINAYIEYDLGD